MHVCCLLPDVCGHDTPVNRPVLPQITRLLLGSLQSAYWANWSVDDTLNMEQPYILQHLHTLGDKLLIRALGFSSVFHAVTPKL